MQEFWVFGYGSLMWNPGFAYEERIAARVSGWHRALCIYSWFHRGTPEAPGLVLGLDRGGGCRGIAFRVAPPNIDATLAYLREREQVTAVYREMTMPAVLVDGSQRRIAALTYVADRSHPQYAGKLPQGDLERLIRQGVGNSGRNPDYLFATVDHMREAGIPDARLFDLADRLRAAAD